MRGMPAQRSQRSYHPGHKGRSVRVLISAWACDPTGGTEGANAWFTAEELAKAGADVHILTRSSNHARTATAINNLDLDGRGSIAVSCLPDHLPSQGSLSGLGVYARYTVWQARCHRWASDPANGVWDVGHHITYGTISLPVGLAGCGFPLVIGPVGGGQVLDPEHRKWFEGSLHRERVRTLAIRRLLAHTPVARRAARAASLVLATNLESRDFAKRLGGRRVELALAEGVREPQIQQGPAPYPSERKIVWIGSFRPLKAAGLAISAFRRVLSDLPDARLVFVGDGPTRSIAESSTRDLLGDGRVQFLGRLAWQEAQAELRSARVHLFTSVRDSSSAQTLEAAAHGIPTIAMNAYGCRAFLQRPGFELVEPRPGAELDRRFADRLVEALTWPQERWVKEGHEAFQFALENRYRSRAIDLIALYRELT